MIKNILIFVGGKGTRLGNITKKTPKPLIKFNKKPFLDYLLFKLSKVNAENIYLLTCYKSNFFFKKYNKKKIKNTKIFCIKETKFLGTSGSLYNSKKLIKNNTLVCNGDTYFDYNFQKLNNIKLKNKLVYFICVDSKNYKSNNKLSNINLKKKLIHFDENSKLMNSGFYIFNTKIIKHLIKIGSLENDVFPKLIKKQLVLGEFSDSSHLDIGTPKNLKFFIKKSKKISLLN